ncbi:transglycosylase domain-containing protein [Fictibacillus sp. KU28468]|uniref:transglycosylase domain-containing protein n=1 Tax=Fictibacillus sp. KU28468 TaxID=2991053 RepID=UPI00223CE24E|nr:transglycosylase domain-containing protein [Fictibacillus sp. KU28468]UZJ80278.1 transglycosylase domain-containing protein [Fictibacillus sp. KU28468]
MSHLEEIKEKWRRFIAYLNEKKIIQAADKTYTFTWNLFLIIVVLFLLGGCLAAGAGAGFLASLVKNEPVRAYSTMKNDIYNYEETSTMYFDKDQLIGKLRADLDRQEVPLKEISPFVKDAVISTEDQYFYEHDGIVPKAILRATLQEVTGSNNRSGGSTLTQQLIKNQILTNEVSFDRKAKEILLALRLEHLFTKEQILEAYLNIVPFGRNSSGRNVAGIQAASQGVFGVDADKLNLPQAAFLAGMPQNPFVYSPFTQQGAVKKDITYGTNRMKTVLNRMLTNGAITPEQYDKALKYNVRKHFVTKKESSYEKYPYLSIEVERRSADILARLAAKKDGKNFDKLKQNTKDEYRQNAFVQLRQKGLKIHTKINKKIYEEMEKTAKNKYLFGSTHLVRVKNAKGKWIYEKQPQEVGSILIENKTGAIISFVGGRDYNREQLNHATQALRQNGSTMKPLLAYAPAIEEGKVQPGYIIPDTPLTIGKYAPNNYDNRFHGLLSARTALAKSYNIPALRSFMRANRADAFNRLEKMGFTTITDTDRSATSVAIGGLTHGVTVEENTNAFATFANQGKFVDAYLIEKIEDKHGKVLYKHKSKPVPVYSPQTSYLILDMMRDVLKPGGTAASIPGRLNFYADWAGKTGTTSSAKDSWFVATNPNVTLGVWHGYDKPEALPTGQQHISQTLWAAFANDAYKYAPSLMAPKHRFSMPSGIVRKEICGISGKLPSDLCRSAGLVTTDLFNVKYAPDSTDNSMDTGLYVIANGKKYKASESTPKEFTQKGVLIDDALFDGVDLKKVTGEENSDHLLPKTNLPENGKNPDTVSGLSSKGGKLSWSASGESDVVGYRVYYSASGNGPFKKIGSLTSDKTSLSAPSGVLYVTAVDVSGKESAPSEKIKSGKEKADPKKPDKPGTDDKKTDDPTAGKKPKDPPPQNDDKKKPKKPAN